MKGRLHAQTVHCNGYGDDCDVDWNGGRAKNEQDYLRKELTLLNKMHHDEDRDGDEPVTVENS